MPIFRAVGLGVFIITLRLLVPDVLAEGQDTAISFLRGARMSADTASSITANAAYSINHPYTAGTTPPLSLPHSPTIPSY